MKNNFKRNNRFGERRLMNCGEECEIVEYRKYSDITVRFLKTEEIVKSTYNHFENGRIKSHFVPSVYGIGIVGLENTLDKEGKQLKHYITWKEMLRRCYDKKFQYKNPTYTNCRVCDEWLFYPNFKKWYEENYYEIDNQRIELDKDILNKNNKVYSPDTCIFVPHNINSLFVKKDANRGDLPIGVNWHEKTQKYRANCSIFDIKTEKCKRQYLGLYNTPQEAFEVYKKAKEENIKLVAEYYKDRIPERLYEAMYEYEVHIND